MDTNENNNNNTMQKVLQGVASLGNERPEEVFIAGEGSSRTHPKTRPRYSGAARRCYKKQKQFQKEELVPGTKATPSEAASNSNSEGAGGSEQARASKQPRPVLSNTPSLSDKHPDKRPRIKDQGSFAQTTKGIVRLAVIGDGFPHKKLGDGEVAEIRKLIRGRIIALQKGTKAPTFTDSWIRDGALIFACANDESANWLKSLFADLRLRNVPLRVLPVDELPKRHRVVVHVQEPDFFVKEAIELLDRQNVSLASGDWVVSSGRESRDASSSHFACLVTAQLLEALKACNFKPFCGSTRATVKLLGKEHREGPAVAETSN
ncbi:uncharacterized protein LOC114934410 [Nylanderia fulva]|uniref:uncharacterized protein LOC114934410 n=1 Tax=Nylanderia fulva TaxID=613905 RepID=UPI0010FBAA12|nr:uncharacterized protein LOC114934410 [Nylanderia fulva]